jgi:mono/diheme cytochrome c family protein
MNGFKRYAALAAVAAATAAATAQPRWTGIAEASEDARGTIRISLVEGKEWTHSFRAMLVAKVTNRPQMAFWLEDASGAYVATIFATRRTAVQDWRAGFGEKRELIKRPSSLPVWARKHAERGVEPKSLCGACHGLHKRPKKDATDPALAAMTGATPKSGFAREWTLLPGIKPGRYVVRAEINHSKDFNAAYPGNAGEGEAIWSGGSMGSGQPSLVYEGTIVIGGDPSSATLERIGHGHPSGASGEVFRGLESLTTALEIVESIRVEFIPGG